MKATITKIHPIKKSRNGNSFVRVEFKCEDGSWAKTDLCPTYRNFNRWRPLLQVGSAIKNLVLKADGEIDADSYLEDATPHVPGRWVEREDGAMVFVPDEPQFDEARAKEIEDQSGRQEKLI